MAAEHEDPDVLVLVESYLLDAGIPRDEVTAMFAGDMMSFASWVKFQQALAFARWLVNSQWLVNFQSTTGLPAHD